MYKLMGMFRFQPGLDKDETRKYWAEVHGPLIAKFPGLIAYAQYDPIERVGAPDSPTAEEEDYDAFIAHWYPDKAACDAAMQSEEWAAADADGAQFVDLSSPAVASVEERIILDGKRAQVKTMYIARLLDDKKKSSDYWTDPHGPLTLEAGGFTRYVQNHTIESFTKSDGEPEFDGISEHWFSDRKTYDEAMASPEWAGLGEDGVNFLDSPKSWGAIVRERFLKQ